jgi:uncharacterized protein
MFLTNSSIFFWDTAIALMLACGVAVIILCTAHLRHGGRDRRGCGARLGIGALRTLAFVCTLIVFYGSFIEPHLLTVTHLQVSLPIERRLRIVVLADFHVGPYKGKEYVERVVRKTNELMPDIVILAGDYVLQERVTLGSIDPLTALKDLRPSLGTFAVMGNHDHGLHRSVLGLRRPVEDHTDILTGFFEQLGITVLANRHEILSLGTESIAIAGVDDVIAKDADLGAALAGIPEGMAVILAAHNPDVMLDPLIWRASLVVAGHTHGGQIRLPWFGSVAMLPTHLGQQYDQGVFQMTPATQLAITRGVGESGARSRLFAPPEILLLEFPGMARPD